LVFYRTNAQSRAIEEALLGAGIPYRIFGGLKFYDRKEIRDIIAYLRILINPYDSQSVLRVINTPPRGIGVSTVANVEALATSEGINLVEAARRVAKGSKALGKFVELYDHLSSMADILPLSNLIKEIIEASGYLARLESIGGDEAQSRIENLVELQVFSGRLDLAGETPRETIGKFLDKASLSSSAEQPANESTQESVAPAIGGTVSLTTLHLAKGLEFPIVFLTGMEEGLIPHYRSLQDPTAIEEERRLCYVGITRAMQQLTISRCENREMFSSGGGFGTGGGYRTPSRFLRDIPTDVINLVKNWGRNSSYRYHPIEEDDGGYRETTFSKSRSSSSNISLSMVKGTNGSFLADNGATRPRTDLIQCADALATEDTRPFLSAEETVVGMKVYHPTFGSGTLLDIEGDLQKKPESARIMVDFEKTAGKKRLILKYARLRIVSEP
jgi:DNA helicase-2/ATP-dependent DNA helicase PcrA